MPTDAKPETALEAPKKKKKKQSAAAMQRELRDLAKPLARRAREAAGRHEEALRPGGRHHRGRLGRGGDRHPVDGHPARTSPGRSRVAAVAAVVWLVRYVNKSREMAALLRSASQTEEGRKDALKKLETDFKKGDVQASIARAQLEMQEDPRKALATLESVDLGKQMVPVADQVRCTRATIHLQLGEIQEARALVDKMELGKQQDAKTRAMFAAVAGEAWGRTGQAKKGSSCSSSTTRRTPSTARCAFRCGARGPSRTPERAT